MRTSEWQSIPGFPDYEIGSTGQVRSWRGKPIKGGVGARPTQPKNLQPVARSGYRGICLTAPSKKVSFVIHRLVAAAFIPNPDNKPEVNHIDGDKGNNHVSNLEWVTSLENSQHAIRLGNVALGERNNLTKYSTAQVQAIKTLHQTGLGYTEIAAAVDCPRNYVWQICTRRIRKADL